MKLYFRFKAFPAFPSSRRLRTQALSSRSTNSLFRSKLADRFRRRKPVRPTDVCRASKVSIFRTKCFDGKFFRTKRVDGARFCSTSADYFELCEPGEFFIKPSFFFVANELANKLEHLSLAIHSNLF